MKVNLLSSAVLTAYFLTCGSLYLWGFWLHFDLNILQFVDVSDIVKATLLPVITVLFLFFIQTALNHINNPASESSQKLWKAGGGFKATVYMQYSFFAFVVCSGGYGILMRFINGTKAEKYLCLGLFILSPVFYVLAFKTTVMAYLGKARPIVLSSICLIPLIFMNKGINDAQKILAGENTFLVESNTNCSPLKESKYRYIATLSDKAFAYSLSDNSLCIFKFDYLKLIKEPVKEKVTKDWLTSLNDKAAKLFGGT
jgi:hypothetical protein